MVVYNDSLLIYLDFTVIHFTDSDTSYILVVVDCTDKNLCVGIRITCWSRDVVYDSLEERSHILSLVV